MSADNSKQERGLKKFHHATHKAKSRRDAVKAERRLQRKHKEYRQQCW